MFASTLSDHETPAEKCEEDEEGFDGCSEYLYSKYGVGGGAACNDSSKREIYFDTVEETDT